MSDREKPPTPERVSDQGEVWSALRKHTSARIGLGRVGASLPTNEILQFSLAHARARDAVHAPLDVDALMQPLHQKNYRGFRVKSRAADRTTYLVRPDLGRQLDEDSNRELRDSYAGKNANVAIVLADGLSSLALQKHSIEMLDRLRSSFESDWDWANLPVVIAEQARVALGDDVALATGARMVIVLIGERPGLKSPDSLGIYVTYAPKKGQADSGRNCISNIRPEGLAYDDAIVKLRWLVQQSIRLKLTGVGLKDNSDVAALGGVSQDSPPDN